MSTRGHARGHLEGVAQVVAILIRQPDEAIAEHAELIQELDTLADVLYLNAIANRRDRWLECDRVVAVSLQEQRSSKPAGTGGNSHSVRPV